MRNRAWRRHQKNKKIRSRLHIVKNCWNYRDLYGELSTQRPPGELDKFNFTCNCWMCKIEKRRASKEKFRRQLKRSGKTRKDILQDLVA